jgi:Xaa-Pro aminopeptidase
MTVASGDRAAESAAKLGLLRNALLQAGAGAIRLRGADWFSWATAGGDCAVRLASDCGVAELLVTADEACVLTDEVEAERIRQEEVPAGFTYHIAPWAEAELHDTYALNAAASGGNAGIVLSDRPRTGEQALPHGLRLRRMALTPAEQERYRALGREAAEALSDVLRAARPDWTEVRLAGAGCEALMRRGIQPAQVLAAGSRRLHLYRHPTPTFEPIGDHAMLVFSARRHGLYANLTRFVTFRPLSLDERNEQHDLLQVEATALDAVCPGQSLAAVYHALDAAYRHANRPDAIRAYHQGGITGYAARELDASPTSATGLEAGMAFAFNPSFDGIKIEDTFLLGPGGLENLTIDPSWPTTTIRGRSRPLWLEATT